MKNNREIPLTIEFIPNNITSTWCDGDHCYRHLIVWVVLSLGGFDKAGKQWCTILIQVIYRPKFIDVSGGNGVITRSEITHSREYSYVVAV